MLNKEKLSDFPKLAKNPQFELIHVSEYYVNLTH